MFDVRPQTVTIGAEIHGIDLANVSNDEIAELKKLWLDWKVLFFRDQHITPEAHIAFARRFGDLEVHPFAPGDDTHPELVVIESNAENQYAASGWHSDVTWRQEPSLGSILRGVVIPPVGGDTSFADAGAAYDRLSDKWKDRLDGMVGIHDYVRVFGRGVSEDKREEMREKYPLAHHPVIRTHPETGAKTVYSNRAFMTGIEGVGDDEFAEISAHLERAIMNPSIQCRFRWQVDSFAMWDNRAVQHCASNDFFPETRRVVRATIIGDRPY